MDCTVQLEPHGSVLKVLCLVWRPATDDFMFDLRGLLDILKERENKVFCSLLLTFFTLYDS